MAGPTLAEAWRLRPPELRPFAPLVPPVLRCPVAVAVQRCAAETGVGHMVRQLRACQRDPVPRLSGPSHLCLRAGTGADL